MAVALAPGQTRNCIDAFATRAESCQASADHCIAATGPPMPACIRCLSCAETCLTCIPSPAQAANFEQLRQACAELCEGCAAECARPRRPGHAAVRRRRPACRPGMPTAGLNPTVSWVAYLRAFHHERPGITEKILRRSRDRGGEDPYRWLLAAVPERGRILDLACGSAPLSTELTGRGYRVVGVDAAFAELQAARRGDRAVAVGDAVALPLATASVDVVACSMALMILSPLPRVLTEIRRVLRADGLLIATVPSSGPLRVRDLPLVAGLVGVLGRRLGYPNDRLLHRAADAFGRAGLRLLSDERRRFGYHFRRPEDADLFLDSLYLPGLTVVRRRVAGRYLRLLARFQREMPIPIRRMVAIAQ